MTPELIFKICNMAVLPGWVLLIFCPRWKWSAKLIACFIIPGLLSIVYVYLMVVYFYDADGGFMSLAQVARLMDTKTILLAGWIHYLAFDLFVGSWEVLDAQKLGIHHLFIVPCLILTFMFGPAGFVLYLVMRSIVKIAK